LGQYILKKQIEDALKQLKKNATGRATGFVIGNTSDFFTDAKFYQIPIRETDGLIYGGVIIRDVSTARAIAKLVDGEIEYIFVDDEKKIREEYYGRDDVGNIEKAVRPLINKSKLLTYKGNDLAVDATDALLSALLNELGNITVAIIGMGNLGSKIALRLVERGVHVRAYRRNQEKLQAIVAGINAVKSPYTHANVRAVVSSEEACKDADVVIGACNEKQVITKDIVRFAREHPVLIDAGKGCFSNELAEDTSNLIYRIDVSMLQKYLFVGLIEIQNHFTTPLGRRAIPEFGETLISIGLLGARGEIIVDDIGNPKRFIGISAGDGTLLPASGSRTKRLSALEEYLA